MWSRLAVVGAFFFLLTDGTAVLAADPPGRVGRLSLIEGTVSLRSPQPVNADNAADNATPELKDEWAPAALNYPVTSGNSLWTESGARAEVQIGPAEVRLNEQTELEVLRLDDRSVDLALHQGTANIRIGDVLPGGLLIDTPRGPVTLTQRGSYRIDVDTGGDSDTVQVTAFDGEAKVSVETPEPTDTHTVARGQSLKLSGEPIQIALADARTTAFDDWARSRDPRRVAAAQPRTVVAGQPALRAVSPTVSPVSTQMTGYQDLAPYGTWQQAPDYGTVWYPATVTPEWAPYRYGQWAYVAPWGWTWIDDAPWGFTPFHYGRWVRVGPRWAWWPGHRTPRPVYAPALVAFVGGNGWSLSIGSGRARPVGWVPLAPYEVYRPHYRTSATYVRNVNITTVNKTVINNITVNNNNTEINRFTNRNAVTAVSADTFARGRKVNEAKIDVPRKELDRAKTTNDVRAIKPAAIAVQADQPRPTAHRDATRNEERRRVNPAITAREPDRSNQRRDPAIERRNAAIETAPQNREQGRTQERNQERNPAREQRRDATPQPAQQAAPAAAPQPQRDAEQRQQRDQAELQRRQRDETQDQQRREQQEQRQRRDRQPPEQRSEQPTQSQQNQAIVERQQRREAQQRQQAEQQQRADEQVRQQGQREAQEQQQRDVQHRQAQDQQAREAAQRDAAREQQRQQQHAQDQQRREQSMREQRQREVAQEQQQQMRQREQADSQQRQAQEQQRRSQAEQQQRQAQEQQQRAQQDQQRQQQEQAQGEQRRRSPEGRPDGKRNRDG